MLHTVQYYIFPKPIASNSLIKTVSIHEIAFENALLSLCASMWYIQCVVKYCAYIMQILNFVPCWVFCRLFLPFKLNRSPFWLFCSSINEKTWKNYKRMVEFNDIVRIDHLYVSTKNRRFCCLSHIIACQPFG